MPRPSPELGGRMSVTAIRRFSDASIRWAIWVAVWETDGPPAEATSRVSWVPVASKRKAASVRRVRTHSRATAVLEAAVAFTGSPSRAFSWATIFADTCWGATTATGIRCGVGEWKAPTYETMKASWTSRPPSTRPKALSVTASLNSAAKPGNLEAGAVGDPPEGGLEGAFTGASSHRRVKSPFHLQSRAHRATRPT